MALIVVLNQEPVGNSYVTVASSPPGFGAMDEAVKEHGNSTIYVTDLAGIV